MSRRKYSAEIKIKACKEYEEGKTPSEIARELGMTKRGNRQVSKWIERYQAGGEEVFDGFRRSSTFSLEERTKIVERYLNEHRSMSSICAEEKISSISTLREWIKVYNKSREINPMDEETAEMSMNTADRHAEKPHFTKEDRIRIVKEYVEGGGSCKEIADKYNITENRLYDWARKYSQHGESGLDDNRGRKIPLKEITTLDEARKLIEELNEKTEELEIKVELLAKQLLTKRR